MTTTAKDRTASNPSPTRPCPKCQVPSPVGATFCGSCGSELRSLAATHIGAPRPPDVSGPAAAQPGPSTGPLGELPVELGPYRVESVIGSGGMGWVYKATDTGLARVVAIKTLSPELAASQEARARFEREARTVAALENPHITAIYFLDAHAKVPYYAMEFVQGESLEDRLARQGRLPLEDACRLVTEAAGALAAAAAAGVVHRDIKPSNLLLRQQDGAVKITDFGLAKPQADKSLTGSQVIIGTPLYMSPEQAMGKTLDFRSDLYSLGVTFYHCLAGRPPFDDDSAMGVILKHIKEPLPPLAPLAPNAPPALLAVVEKMLAKDPAARHSTYEELAAELAAAKRNGRPRSRQVQVAKLTPPGPAPTAAREGPPAPPAAAAPAPAAVEPPATRGKPFARSFRLLRHPVAFFASMPSNQPFRRSFTHFVLVAVMAGFWMQLRRGKGAMVLVAFPATVPLSILVYTVLLIRGFAGNLRDAFAIVCYATTPYMLGGFYPLSNVASVVLMGIGAFTFRRRA